VNPFSQTANQPCDNTGYPLPSCTAGLVCLNLSSPSSIYGTCSQVTACSNSLSQCQPGYSCQCKGSSPQCVQTQNVCQQQQITFATCAQKNGCASMSPNIRRNPTYSCGWKYCSNEAISLLCCQSCGGSSSTTPIPGLNCAANTYNPPLNCATGVSCTRAPGICPVSNIGGITGGGIAGIVIAIIVIAIVAAVVWKFLCNNPASFKDDDYQQM